MRAVRRLAVLATAALTCTIAFSGVALAVQETAVHYQENQPGLDASDANNGGWDNTTPNLAARPYVKYYAVNNGGSTIPIINNMGGSPVQTKPPEAATDTYAFISPVNACTRPASGGQCYASPNRFSVWIGRADGTSWTRDLTGAIPAVTANTTIELIIGFHSGYSTLGWSWANGIPTWWTPAVTPGTGGDIRIKFTPKTTPSTNNMPPSCSTVPVTSCDYTPNSAEEFRPQVLVSMDNTLGALFTGSLFATTASALGALDVPAGAGFASNPTMSYQLAGPHTLFGGATRTGGLYAVIPSPILTVFGTSAASFDQSLIPVQRTGDAGAGDVAWTPWTVGANGINAMLLSVTGITFSAPKFVVGRASSGSGSSGGGAGGGGGGSSSTGTSSSGSGNPTSLKVGQKATFAQLLAIANLKTPAGAKATATVSTPKICKVVGKAIKGLAVGTCRGTMTITPKKGKATKKAFTFKVTKTGKRLPVMLHR